MYDELVKALRECVLSKPCNDCPYYDPNGPTEKCATMNIAAADAIEELSKRVPVPPHGRLIDADALLNNKGVGTQIAGWGKMYHETCIEYAPTIIPAEEGE